MSFAFFARRIADHFQQRGSARVRRRADSPLQFERLEARELLAADVLYRVNAGGAALADGWLADTAKSPSVYTNASAAKSETTSVSNSINMSHASLPTGMSAALFQTERWDNTGGTEMSWDFAVTPGTYEVRLYFAETYSKAQKVGGRVFDVLIEGQTVLDNYDVYAEVGGYKGAMKSFTVTADTNLDIDFLRGVQNPAIKGIEILRAAVGNELGSSQSALDFAGTLIGNTVSKTFTLSNLGSAGDPSITINPQQMQIVGANAGQFSFQTTTTDPVTLAPGESLVVTVRFTANDAATKSATLQIPHSGDNSPIAISLSGSGVATVPIGFGKSALDGEISSRPTTLQFGPDDRLYVATQDGLIHIYTVVRNGANDYDVVSVETITSIQQIPNHDDDGSLNTSVNERLVTGILVTGTASNPVIYVTSSDPRIGGGNSGNDLNLDTNSGILSRLTWNGSSWVKLDLVRGLPRSEENHASNGMALDEQNKILYIAQGGHTNMGATSKNFALLPEYALSAAILSVDLDAIGNTTYDIPTLDDEDRPTNNDANDPFGGNDGKNQARLVPGGPVQVYSPGFRNPYDVVLTEDGRLYTIDNGPNSGWGGLPANEGPEGNATNDRNDGGNTHNDGLHLITGPGFYGGHPNPTRSNMDNTFNASNSQSPVSQNNPIESDYLTPGQGDGSLFTWGSSTNGLTEYTASNFQGSMKGDLLAASFDNSIKRVKLNAAGDTVVEEQKLFSSVGSIPLDVTAVGDDGLFPGTIWVVDVVNGNVYVFEPNDFGTGSGGGGVPDPDPNDADDLDGDGYSNDDEIANNTNPNSSADTPPDFDQDFLSDLLDDDDDNDSLLDTVDPFAIDPNNGMTTFVGTSYQWENDSPAAGGLLNMGFTGLMTNGVDNYKNLYDITKLTAGGAAGVLTMDDLGAGDALGNLNSQEHAFQFGVNLSNATGPVTAHTRLVAPFASETPTGEQSMGMFIGTGDQDNYLKIVVTANNGNPGITYVREVNGVVTNGAFNALALPGIDLVDLYLTINRAAGTVQASYQLENGSRINLGAPISVPASWISGSQALAVGIISTRGNAPAIPCTWDFLEVVEEVPTNVAPVLAPITNPTVEAGKTVGIAVSATDADGDNIVLTATNLPSFATFTDHGNGTGTISLAPSVAQVGAFNFMVTATDNGSPVLVHSRNVTVTVAAPVASGTVMYRVNAGGGALSGGWEADTSKSPSPNTNASASKSQVTGVSNSINTSHASVPVGTPASLFQSERWDDGGGSEMQWDFAVDAGMYEVRLYFAETFSKAQKVGGRVFDVMIEGQLVLDNYDVYADVGGYKGVVKSFVVSADSNIDIDFLHGVQNPAVKGIEIIKVGDDAGQVDMLGVSVTSHDFGSMTLGQTETLQVQLKNLGGAGDPNIVINRDGTLLSGAGSSQYVFNYTSAGAITLAPGEETLIEVTFRPTVAGTALATLTIPHSGSNPPLEVSLMGQGVQAPIASPLATVEVDSGGTMSDSSTYTNGSFKLTNQSPNGIQVTSVHFDISQALLPDVVFDPTGTAGDPVGKDFTANSGTSATGLLGHKFGSPLHNGYQALDIAFDNFDPGETFSFSVDIDPTTIRGAADPGPEASGSVSGFELIGSQVTITFSDGSTITTDLYRKGSSTTGSTATLQLGTPAAPTLQVLGIGTTPATTSTATQTVRIFGTAGATVQLLRVESALHLDDVPGGGYDVDPYESNKAIAASEQTVTIGAGGFVDVPVTLTKSHDDGGYNHLIAVTKAADGRTSSTAKLLVKYEPTVEPPVEPGDYVYRVNAGGGALAGGWSSDMGSSESPYSNVGSAKSGTYGTSASIDMSHASIPAGTPMELFQSERWDSDRGAEMQWDFAVEAGTYEVRLYFAEIYSKAQKVGGRVFDVLIDGQTVLDNYDVYADVGANRAVMKSFTITSDGNIDIDFLHGTQNPSIKGIEIVRV